MFDIDKACVIMSLTSFLFLLVAFSFSRLLFRFLRWWGPIQSQVALCTFRPFGCRGSQKRVLRIYEGAHSVKEHIGV